MIRILLVLLLLWPSLAAAEVVNVEFNFTPFTGDPAKADHVETVPGSSTVYINNIPILTKEVSRQEVPVLFEEREISAAVWVPVASLGPVLRKGKNKIRVEFDPADTKAPYRAQLRWASVTDQVKKSGELPGRMSETNQANEGADDRKVTGQVVFEREFVADFAKDQPWHHYPPVTSLTDEDKKNLAVLVKQREDAFKPDFSTAYQILGKITDIQISEMKKFKCLEKGYSAGIRITAGGADKLDFVLTGNPEVVVRAKSGPLYYPVDRKALNRIKDDDTQMCLGAAFMALFPERLVFVRAPSGKWEAAY